MTQSKEYSSLPLAISIASVICLSAAGGWFMFQQDTFAQADAEQASTEQIDGEAAAAVSQSAHAQIDVGAELRKARLATDADFIVSPAGRNAFYYYERVLLADPNNELAMAEFGMVLTRVPQVVADYLAAGDYVSAYNVAARVAAGQPEHPVAQSLPQILNDYVDGLVAQGEEAAATQDENSATEILSELAQLPGLSSQYLAASQASILEKMQQAGEVAEQETRDVERLAEEKSVSEWTTNVRDAIASGQLIAPTGNSARDLLAARKTPVEARKQLTKEFLAALASSSEESLDRDYLAAVETYLNSDHDLVVDGDSAVEGVLAIEFDDGSDTEVEPGIDTPIVETDDVSDRETNRVAVDDVVADNAIDEALTTLRGTIEKQLMVAEGKRVLSLADFVHINAAPAQYPVLAGARNLTGWVEVEFTVTAGGETAEIEVRQAEPIDVFEGSAIAAVKGWTFEPRQFRGQPIDQRTVARLKFELE